MAVRPDGEKTNFAVPAFDYSQWHSDPACIVDVINGGNGKLYVRCSTHDTVADLEAVGQRITTQASSH